MKYVLIVLMWCLPLSVAMVLALQPASLAAPATEAERKVELRELRMERREVSHKIVLLQAQEQNFLPR